MAPEPKKKTARKASTVAKPKAAVTRTRINLNKLPTSSVPSRQAAANASKGPTGLVHAATAAVTGTQGNGADSAESADDMMEVDEVEAIIEDDETHLG
jgi:hypothetical protein